MSAFGVGLRLVADRLEAVDAVLEGRIIDVGHARLDGVIKPLEAGFGFRSTFVQFGDMLALALTLFLSPVEHGGEDRFQPFRLEQTFLQMAGDQIVQLLHRHGHAFAGGRSLPGFHRAGIVAIASALAGTDRHGPAAFGTVDQAGKQGRATDDSGWRDPRVTGFEQRLYRVEGLAVDDRRDRHDHDLADRLQFFRLAALVELMLAHIGAARQDAVNLANAPAPAVAGEDASAVEVGDDVFHAHLAGRAVAFQGEAIDQPHRVSMQRIDLQLLLGLGPALLGRDDPVADRRKSAVPEALPGVLLQGAHDVLGIFLRLILIEQRHDLPHHLMHRIVADLLGDRQQLDTVLRQLADVELHIEGVAEEAREAVNHDDIERRRLGRARLDHTLELRAAVVGR